MDDNERGRIARTLRRIALALHKVAYLLADLAEEIEPVMRGVNIHPDELDDLGV